MKITYDPQKRLATLEDRGLDFDDAVEFFSGDVLDIIDERFDYGETRVLSVGHLRGRMMIVVWTQRDETRHIISMRKANDREQASYRERLGTR